MKTILITGASGLIASNFVIQYNSKYKFVKLSHLKKPGNITFNQLENDLQLRSQVDIILNLAGANIGSQRWSKSRKHELLTSRINTTHKIVELFNRSEYKPHLISASAIGIYNFSSTNDENTEIDYQHYETFSQQLTKQWEQVVLQYDGKVTITRFGVVLSSRGGALSKILPPFKLGLGGKISDGNQGFPWIALDDLLAALILIIDHTWTGVFNLTAPQHITNGQLTKVIGKVWNRPTYLTLPAFLIKMLYGKMGKELLLSGSKVIPQRLIDAKFNYSYPDIESCLIAIKEHKL